LNTIFEVKTIDITDADGLSVDELIAQWKKRKEVEQIRKYGKVIEPIEDK
jgi:hypothetical protein